MSQITIIKDDSKVVVDGFAVQIPDMSFVPDEIHALQWKNSKGWIEYKQDENDDKPHNLEITELPSWVSDCLSSWDVESTKAKAIEAARLFALEEARKRAANNPVIG